MQGGEVHTLSIGCHICVNSLFYGRHRAEIDAYGPPLRPRPKRNGAGSNDEGETNGVDSGRGSTNGKRMYIIIVLHCVSIARTVGSLRSSSSSSRSGIASASLN